MQVRRCWCGASGSAGGSPLLLLCPTSDTSPPSQKASERLRSPGTVRKLSLKMKKLPELRRKLSLRSSSRWRRQEAEDRAGDAAAAPPVSPNQNVLSRYHLDSSAPPARAQRRPSRGPSASKGGGASGVRSCCRWTLRAAASQSRSSVFPPGHLSDGDSPELLPRQQAAAVPTSQEQRCDLASFQLYMGSELQRCSRRVTGLLTVHLLGLEEMRSSR